MKAGTTIPRPRRVREEAVRIRTAATACGLLLMASRADARQPRTTAAACAALTSLQGQGVALEVTKSEWFGSGAAGPGAWGNPTPARTDLPADCLLAGTSA